MSFAFGLQMIHPSAADSKPHILGHATARTTTGDTLFEVWNGSTSASLRAKLDLDGRWLIGDGTFGKPAFAFKEDTDCGMYRIAANNVGIAVNGAKVLDVATTGISVVGTITASTSITATTTVTATTSVLTDLVKARSNAPLVFQLSDGTAVCAGSDGARVCGRLDAGLCRCDRHRGHDHMGLQLHLRLRRHEHMGARRHRDVVRE
jgi:hypothetical protein